MIQYRTCGGLGHLETCHFFDIYMKYNLFKILKPLEILLKNPHFYPVSKNLDIWLNLVCVQFGNDLCELRNTGSLESGL